MAADGGEVALPVGRVERVAAPGLKGAGDAGEGAAQGGIGDLRAILQRPVVQGVVLQGVGAPPAVDGELGGDGHVVKVEGLLHAAVQMEPAHKDVSAVHRVRHLARKGTVEHAAGFIARELLSQFQLLPVQVEAHGMGGRLPAGVDQQIVGGHAHAAEVHLRSRCEAGGGVPAVKFEGVRLVACGVVRREAPVRNVLLERNGFGRDHLARAVEGQGVEVPRVVEVDLVGLLVERGVEVRDHGVIHALNRLGCGRDVIQVGQAVDLRRGLLLHRGVVAGVVDAAEDVGHALAGLCGQALCGLALRQGNPDSVAEQLGDVPLDVRAVLPEAEVVHCAACVGVVAEFVRLPQELRIQTVVIALDGLVRIVLGVPDVMLAVPGAEEGLRALPAVGIGLIQAGDGIEHVAGPHAADVRAVARPEGEVVVAVVVAHAVDGLARGIAAGGVAAGRTRAVQGRNLIHLAALDHRASTVHVIIGEVVEGIVRACAACAEFVAGTADDVILLPVHVLHSVVELQGERPARVVEVDHGGAVARDADLAVGVVELHEGQQFLKVCVDGDAAPEVFAVLRQYRLIGGRVDGGAAEHAVVIVVRVLQPVHRREGGLRRRPLRRIAAVLCGHGGGQGRIRAAARPSVKGIALTHGGRNVDGRAVAGVDGLHAVAAAQIEAHQVVAAVVVDLHHRGAVRSDGGAVVQQGIEAVVGPRRLRHVGVGQPLLRLAGRLGVVVVAQVLQVVDDGVVDGSGLVDHGMRLIRPDVCHVQLHDAGGLRRAVHVRQVAQDAGIGHRGGEIRARREGRGVGLRHRSVILKHVVDDDGAGLRRCIRRSGSGRKGHKGRRIRVGLLNLRELRLCIGAHADAGGGAVARGIRARERAAQAHRAAGQQAANLGVGEGQGGGSLPGDADPELRIGGVNLPLGAAGAACAELQPAGLGQNHVLHAAFAAAELHGSGGFVEPGLAGHEAAGLHQYGSARVDHRGGGGIRLHSARRSRRFRRKHARLAHQLGEIAIAQDVRIAQRIAAFAHHVGGIALDGVHA